mgnify:FL=1
MKKAVKKLVNLGLTMIIIGVILTQKDTIITFINSYFNLNNQTVTLGEKNKYYRNYDFSYVQNTDNFTPECRQDILNIYYTAINAGKNTFTFYCSKDYTTCLDDIKELANNQETLSYINNFVHPYNGFQHIETEYDSLGKITITIHKSYTEKEITEIEKKLDYIEQNILDKNKSTIKNIKAAHDYIINNTKYDIDKKSNGTTKYESDIAYGPLIQGYGICGGYTDAMELVLERMNVISYKVASENHIWNGVNLDNKWYHLDLTWDDPVTPDNSQILDNSFFLIDTNKLLEIETTEHQFNQDIYTELK